MKERRDGGLLAKGNENPYDISRTFCWDEAYHPDFTYCGKPVYVSNQYYPVDVMGLLILGLVETKVISRRALEQCLDDTRMYFSDIDDVRVFMFAEDAYELERKLEDERN